MTMTSSGHRMTAIKIEITPAVARINPNTFATFGDNWHLFVSRQLELLFENLDVFCVHNAHHQCLEARYRPPTYFNRLAGRSPPLNVFFLSSCAPSFGIGLSR